MSQKAVFLDRDGTINIDKQYIYRRDQFQFLPGAIEGMQLLQNAGYILVLITNQSGIARGYYTEDDYIKLSSWLKTQLAERGVTLAGEYYCPHHPQGIIATYRKKCDCRKPRLGMFWRAISDLGVDLSTSYAIGDKMRDCAICLSTPCNGYLIGANEHVEIITAVKSHQFERIEYENDLLSCAKKIVAYAGLHDE